jgi:hypothetical protein
MNPKRTSPKNGLEDILSRLVFKLPHHISQRKYFPANLEQLLFLYKSETSKSKSLLRTISKYDKTGQLQNSITDYTNDIAEVCDKVLEVLKTYLDGSPAEAYKMFCAVIDNSLLENILKTQQVQLLKREQSFYRLRADKEINAQKIILPLELFHIPFEKRHRVATQRYSIPGFPCLYAGSTLLVSCKELNILTHKDLKKAKIVRLSNNSQVNYIDISPINVKEKLAHRKTNSLLGNASRINYEIYCYGLLYPLIAACHCKINYKESTHFKVEYIIPQLILQWYRDFDKLKSISGIRYLSNRVKSPNITSKHYNFVFPVKDKPKKKGHCGQLKNLFNSTDVIHASKLKLKSTGITAKISEIQKSLQKMKLNKLK